MLADVADLQIQLASLEEHVHTTGSEEPYCLRPERLRKFLEEARPRMDALQGLAKDLEKATDTMRIYVAESPGQTLKQMLESLTLFLDRLPAPAEKRPLRRRQTLPPAMSAPMTKCTEQPRRSLTSLFTPRSPVDILPAKRPSIVPVLRLDTVAADQTEYMAAHQNDSAGFEVAAHISVQPAPRPKTPVLPAMRPIVPALRLDTVAADQNDAMMAADKNDSVDSALAADVSVPPAPRRKSLSAVLGMMGRPCAENLVPCTPRSGRGTSATARDGNQGIVGVENIWALRTSSCGSCLEDGSEGIASTDCGSARSSLIYSESLLITARSQLSGGVQWGAMGA